MSLAVLTRTVTGLGGKQTLQKKSPKTKVPRYQIHVGSNKTKQHSTGGKVREGGGGGGVYSYSMDTIEGPRAPAVKLTARHSSEGCSPVSVVGTLKALAHPPKTKDLSQRPTHVRTEAAGNQDSLRLVPARAVACRA